MQGESLTETNLEKDILIKQNKIFVNSIMYMYFSLFIKYIRARTRTKSITDL